MFLTTKSEFIRAVKNGNKKELIKAVQKSDKLLNATWRMDEETVAQIIEEMHSEITAPTFYNNEQALRSVIKMAYISSIDYYTRIDELPTGKGFADMVFWPKDYASCPALIVELKWNKSSLAAIEQIDKKQYTAIFNGYKGNVLKVGINYSIKDKNHTCKIEKFSFPRT